MKRPSDDPRFNDWSQNVSDEPFGWLDELVTDILLTLEELNDSFKIYIRGKFIIGCSF